jgi:VanZ family protein
MRQMLSRNLIVALNAALLALIIVAALGPSRMIPRTGLGWQFDHFTGYFVFTSMFCQIWRRVAAVGASVTGFAVLLELCQGLTPDRFPDFMGAFYSISGIVAAVLIADFFVRARRHMIGSSLLRAPY